MHGQTGQPRETQRRSGRLLRGRVLPGLGLLRVLIAALVLLVGVTGLPGISSPPVQPAHAATSVPSTQSCLRGAPCFERIVSGVKYVFSWSEQKQSWGFIGYTVKKSVEVPSATTWTYPGEVTLPNTCYDDAGLLELRNNQGSCGAVSTDLGVRGCWTGVMEWQDPQKPFLPCYHHNAWSRTAPGGHIDREDSCPLSTVCPGGHQRAGYYWAGHAETWNTLQWGWVTCEAVLDPSYCRPPWKTPVESPPITLSMQPRTVHIALTPTDAIPVGGAQRITTVTSALTVEDCTLWVSGTGAYDTGPDGIAVPCSAYPDLMPRGVAGSQQLELSPVGVRACASEDQADGCYYWASPERRFTTSALGKTTEVVQRKVYAYRASGEGQGIRLSASSNPWAYEWVTKTTPASQCEQWHAWLPPDGAHPTTWQADFPINPQDCTIPPGGTTVSWTQGTLTPTVSPAGPVLLSLLNPTATPSGN